MGYIWPEGWEHHGTTNGYTSYMCRCELCKTAIREYRSERRSRNLLGVDGTKPTPGVKHGAAAYKENSCRCDVCKRAASRQGAESRQRRIQRLVGEIGAVPVAARRPAATLPDEFVNGFTDEPVDDGPMLGKFPLKAYMGLTDAQRLDMLYDQEDWEDVYHELQDRKMWVDYDAAKAARHEWLRTHGARSGQEGAGESLGLPDMPGYGLTRAEWLASQKTGDETVPAGDGEDFTETNGSW